MFVRFITFPSIRSSFIYTGLLLRAAFGVLRLAFGAYTVPACLRRWYCILNVTFP